MTRKVAATTTAGPDAPPSATCHHCGRRIVHYPERIVPNGWVHYASASVWCEPTHATKARP